MYGTDCSDLSASPYTGPNSGSGSIAITAANPGNYQGCEMYLRDHGNNLSNPIVFQSICDYAGSGLSVSQAECTALEDFYIATEGYNWNPAMNQNWFQRLDVNTWA